MVDQLDLRQIREQRDRGASSCGRATSGKAAARRDDRVQADARDEDPGDRGGVGQSCNPAGAASARSHHYLNYPQVVADVFNANVYTQVQLQIHIEANPRFCFRVLPTLLPWEALTEQFTWLRVALKWEPSLRLRRTYCAFWESKTRLYAYVPLLRYMAML